MAPGVLLALAVAAAAPEDYEFTTDPDRLRADAAADLVAKLSDPAKGREAAQRLVRFGRSAVGPVLAALRSKNLQVRFYAATVLEIIGDEAGTKALLGRLADEKEDPIVRTVAARAMGRAEHAPATDVLLRLAKARDAPPAGEGKEEAPGAADVLAGNEDFRFEVIRALAYIGPGEADELLVSSLSDPSARIREVAAEGLGDHRVHAALGALREALKDPEGAVAAAAAKAIGKMGRFASAAVPDLVAALGNPDARVQRAAVAGLVLTTGRSFRTPARWRKWWEERSALKPAPGAGEEDDFPLPAVIATEIFGPAPGGKRGEGDPVRTSDGGSPPALRMPWEVEEREGAPVLEAGD